MYLSGYKFLVKIVFEEPGNSSGSKYASETKAGMKDICPHRCFHSESRALKRL